MSCAVLLAGALGVVAAPAAHAGTTSVWLHDDAYVLSGTARAYIDVRCDRGSTGYELTVRLTANKQGKLTATGSAAVRKIVCTGSPEQQVVDVKPDSQPFYGSSSALNVGVAELRKAGATQPVATSTRRQYFYYWG